MANTPISLAEQTAAKAQSQEEVEEVTLEQLRWGIMEPRIRRLISDWGTEIAETKKRRAIRKLDVNTDALRSEGKLQTDEVLIGVRVVDENIRKEQPTFVQYLTQSRRLAIFDCKSKPGINVEPLEIAFTKGMSYSGFLRNIFKSVDGAQTHGWDSVEILYDSTKPLHCAVEHIGHENLIFSLDSKDIQAQEFILRAFDVTVIRLERFKKKHGFDPVVVDSVIADARSRGSDNPKNIRIYKYFTKIDDIVYVGWCTLREGGEGVMVTNWLRTPQPLDMGRKTLQEKTVWEDRSVTIPDEMTGMPIATTIKQPVKRKEWVSEIEKQYPIRIFLYSESEEQCITDQKGRVFFDNTSQEAQTALWSLFINGAVRASNVYAAASQPSQTGSALRAMDVTLEHGKIYSDPINFFHVDYPDPAMIRAADGLNVRKAQEMGQSASAVINRDDSRKTAEELKQAKGEQLQMASTPIMFFSGYMREVLSVSWYVVQSQALQGLITLLPIEIPVPQEPPIPGLPPLPPKMVTVNNYEIIGQTYDIKPAGDTDVVRRAEKIEKRLLLLPVIQPTPAYPVFLQDLISELLPEDADKYNAILQQGMVTMEQQMLALAQMLQEATTDDSGAILPEWQPFSAQLQQMFQMIPQGQQAIANKQPNEQSNSTPPRPT